jgi:hypothetical protein
MRYHGGFQFSTNHFAPKLQFVTNVKAAHCPFVILFIESGQAATSTSANQFAAYQLSAQGPDEAGSGSNPVTTGVVMLAIEVRPTFTRS